MLNEISDSLFFLNENLIVWLVLVIDSYHSVLIIHCLHKRFFVEIMIVPLRFVFVLSSCSSSLLSSYFSVASWFLFVFRFGNLNPLNSHTLLSLCL